MCMDRRPGAGAVAGCGQSTENRSEPEASALKRMATKNTKRHKKRRQERATRGDQNPPPCAWLSLLFSCLFVFFVAILPCSHGPDLDGGSVAADVEGASGNARATQDALRDPDVAGPFDVIPRDAHGAGVGLGQRQDLAF